MTSEADIFEVIANYTCESGISLTKGDVVKVIKKEIVWFTFEKDGKIVKAPKGKFRKCIQAGQVPVQSDSTFQLKTSLSNSNSSQPKDTIQSDNIAQPQVSILNSNSFQPKVPIQSNIEIVKKMSGGVMGKTFLERHKLKGQLYVIKRVDYFTESDKKIADEEIAQMKLLTSHYT
ncbi:MAG: hypothetical protein EZS28_014590, partial [Streblomastix strix]